MRIKSQAFMSPADHTIIKKQTAHLSNSCKIKEHYCIIVPSTAVERLKLNDRLPEGAISRKLQFRPPSYYSLCDVQKESVEKKKNAQSNIQEPTSSVTASARVTAYFVNACIFT